MYYKFVSLCNERKVRAADVCRATGIPQNVISNWKARSEQAKEYGNPMPGLSIDNLVKIAKYFDVSLDQFVEGN